MHFPIYAICLRNMYILLFTVYCKVPLMARKLGGISNQCIGVYRHALNYSKAALQPETRSAGFFLFLNAVMQAVHS